MFSIIKNKVLLIILLAVFGSPFGGSAFASDAVFDWGGVYVGGYFANTKVDAERTCTPTPGLCAVQKINAKSASSLDKNTGGFVGFNYTLDSILLGIEISGQYDVAKVKANSVIAGTKGYVELYKLMEYRLRVGYPQGKLLPYFSIGKGAMAQTFASYSGGGTYSSNFNSFGIGIDYAVSENIIAGAEYIKADWYYRNLGSFYRSDGNVTALRFRLGYLF